MRLAMKLEGAMMLPFVLLADAEGKFIDGYSGMVMPKTLINLLTKAIAKPA